MDYQKAKGIFLDADGVLWPDTSLGGILNGLEEATNSLMSLRSSLSNPNDFSFFVVTNQTLAARNLIPEKEFARFTVDFFRTLIDMGLINDFRVCFHHPKAINKSLRDSECFCRKPRAGMITDLLQEYLIRPQRSVIIGDRITDIGAGQLAKLSLRILLEGSRPFEWNDNFVPDSALSSIRLIPANNLDDAATIINRWSEKLSMQF
jgi:D-glycero-D-manno-heptose 1,7-bisphosphate phosphatase